MSPKTLDDPSLNYFAQNDIIERKRFRGVNQRPIPAMEHFHAFPNHVHKDIGITDDIERFIEVVVSHG